MATKTKGLFELIDHKFAQGHEILDLMALSVEDPDTTLTEDERCLLHIGRFMTAAVVESVNSANIKFSLDPIQLQTALWMMTGEALAIMTVQAFDLSTPRARKIARNEVKGAVMAGYDHAIAAIDKHKLSEKAGA
ncbi:hypothetical protein FB480_103423 [Agrobacterium vitis]|nr:hypothetical protein FB480_103423 [Agrobacterium vitis]